MTTDAIDGTVEEDRPDLEPAPGHDIVATSPSAAVAVTPTVGASDLVQRLDVIRDAMKTAMKPDVDYGVIPGTGSKPTLLKPGAEKLGVLFQLDIQIDDEKVWGPGDHLTVMAKAIAYHAPTGTRLGSGEGVCSTREKKYDKRKQERTCPECGKGAVIKGKAEYGGGWLCFKKKDGCGAKWPDGATVIESQTVGEVDNPDLPDTWNTVVKMAKKRARIDVVLAVTGASALFTQDLEDSDPPSEPVPRPDGALSQEKYAALVQAFQDAGSPVDDLAKHIGCLPDPAVIARFCAPEAGNLSNAQADDAIAFLRGLTA